MDSSLGDPLRLGSGDDTRRHRIIAGTPRQHRIALGGLLIVI